MGRTERWDLEAPVAAGIAEGCSGLVDMMVVGRTEAAGDIAAVGHGRSLAGVLESHWKLISR